MLTSSVTSRHLCLSLFETRIGWFGLLGNKEGVCRVTFGHASPSDAREAMGNDVNDVDVDHWSPQLQRQLERYTAGEKVDFTQVPVLRTRQLTPFQQRVIEIVRAIPRGETRTYCEVAALAGSTGAARAVGQVMATNTVPIIIPCHRVVSASGGLGGFSAAGGVSTKKWMLDLEGSVPGIRIESRRI